VLLCPALFGVPCVRSCSTYTEPRLRVQVSEELDGRELRRQARAKYDTMTLSQLQATCDQSWVDASGSREEMIERLIHYEATTNDWPVRLIVAPQVTLHYVRTTVRMAYRFWWPTVIELFVLTSAVYSCSRTNLPLDRQGLAFSQTAQVRGVHQQPRQEEAGSCREWEAY
jgi:hypothetical protein